MAGSDASISFEDGRLDAAIVAALTQALIVVDTTGRITRTNEAAATMIGVSLGALAGAQLRDLPVTVTGRDGQPLQLEESAIYRALGGETVHRMPMPCTPASPRDVKW